MGYETENLKQAEITKRKESTKDPLALLLDPPTSIPARVHASTLVLYGITDLLIDTAGRGRLIPTDEIAQVDVDRDSNKLIITRKDTPEDPKLLRTSTYSLTSSVREWIYGEDVPSLHFPEQTVYNLPIPTMGIWKVTSSIATREEPIMH